MSQTTARKWTHASLACSFIAFISHIAAMRMAASVAIAIAQRQRLADQAQRLSYNGAFDLVAWTAGALALVLALVVARAETPRMRTFIFAAAVVRIFGIFVSSDDGGLPRLSKPTARDDVVMAPL